MTTPKQSKRERERIARRHDVERRRKRDGRDKLILASNRVVLAETNLRKLEAEHAQAAEEYEAAERRYQLLQTLLVEAREKSTKRLAELRAILPTETKDGAA